MSRQQSRSIYRATACNSPAEHKSAPAPTESEQSANYPPQYHVKPAWVDAAGRTRIWAMFNPHRTKMAEFTTKRDARKLADLLNEAMPKERER